MLVFSSMSNLITFLLVYLTLSFCLFTLRCHFLTASRGSSRPNRVFFNDDMCSFLLHKIQYCLISFELCLRYTFNILNSIHNSQEIYHEMKIPERDVTYIVLSVYLRLSTYIHWTGTSPIKYKMDHTQVNLIQLKTFLAFACIVISAPKTGSFQSYLHTWENNVQNAQN